METSIIRQEPVALARHAVKVEDLQAQIAMLHNAMKSVMKKGTHYGTVPGCGDRPTLLKPGAEVIMALFRLAANPVVEELSDNGAKTYRVKVDITTAGGVYLGSGVGECSSDEEKYKWRRPVCDAEWADTPENRRREKYDRYGKKYKQIMGNPSDVANTILKMAKKRALIDACLTCTAASDIFTQDIEDLPEGYVGAAEPDVPKGKPEVKKPQSKSEKPQTPNPSVDDMELRKRIGEMLLDLCEGNQKDAKTMLAHYSEFQSEDGNTVAGVTSTHELKDKRLQTVYGKVKKTWVESPFYDPEKYKAA